MCYVLDAVYSVVEFTLFALSYVKVAIVGRNFKCTKHAEM